MGEGNLRENGFALLFVVSILAVIAALATGFAIATKRQVALARNTVDLAKAHARAEAGFSLGVAGLLETDARTRWRSDGRLRVVSFDGTDITVTIQNEAGKVDLNWAPIELIDGLLREFGVEAGPENQIIDNIRGRRQSVDPSTVPPGELSTGLSSGGPRLSDLAASPFRSVDDLLTIPAMTREIFDRIRPFVTVYAESAHIDAASAPREVLLAIPGIEASDVEAVLASRDNPPDQGPSLAVPDHARQFAGAVEERAVTITAAVKSGATGRFMRRAVIGLTGRPYDPFRVLEWQQDLG